MCGAYGTNICHHCCSLRKAQAAIRDAGVANLVLLQGRLIAQPRAAASL
jgi:hypothetical protein